MKEKRQWKYTILSIGVVAAFLLVWFLVTDVLHWSNNRLMPSPVAVVKALLRKFYDPNPEGATMVTHIAASLQVALSGYGIGLLFGIPLGICMAWYRPVDYLVRPLFDLIRPVPGIAWIPLMIIFFGIGLMSKSMVIFLSSFTACVINSYSGIKQTKAVHLWVGQTFGYSNTRLLFKVAIPTALPMILTGMKGALSSSWGALIAAELLASTAGIGFMIQQARSALRSDIIVAGMVVIGIIGALLSMLLTRLEKHVLKGGRW